MRKVNGPRLDKEELEKMGKQAEGRRDWQGKVGPKRILARW